MTGLGIRSAERLLAALLKSDLLRSDTAKGKVYLGIPFRALRFYFTSLLKLPKVILYWRISQGLSSSSDDWTIRCQYLLAILKYFYLQNETISLIYHL